ncbi:MAG TPA: carboxypeptidase-like regulatory domain-containing protein, partial [Methylomirabilota bacterium]|nr:carboxypeptidase-like regulatory domain-containing protein [Methylomirabilota bacterium]
MIRVAVLLSLVAALACGPFQIEAEAQTVIAGTVKSKAGKPLPGLVLLEKGEIHNNVWDRGALVDAQGRFRLELPSAGQYGLHVYASGYIYAPQAVKLEAGKTLELQVVLVPEPTRANSPIIRRVGFFPWEARQGRVTFVKADVTDPNGDLGPQVLALNAATGRAYALEPPQQVRDLKANFPNGVYQVAVDTPGSPIKPSEWHFVVADHQCNTS